MTVTTNYLVTGNGITGSTANAVQALVSEDRITTWANRTALVTAGLTSAFFTDVGVGGSYWDYVGGRWRPSARRVMLANLLSPLSTQATALGVVYAVPIPAGLWQDGDFLECVAFWTRDGGTSETATCDYRVGVLEATTGLTQGLSTTSLATTQLQMGTRHRLRRLTATTAQNSSIPGNSGAGVSTAAAAVRTIPSADDLSYFQFLGNVSVGAETLVLRSATLYLESGA